jgi:VTC domain-containing protein
VQPARQRIGLCRRRTVPFAPVRSGGNVGHADCTAAEWMSETAVAGLIQSQQGERKFLLEAPCANDIWQRASARLRTQVRDAARPITYHRTTYFDTPDHAYYRGMGPVAQRVRVREYATARKPGAALQLLPPCFLELKQSAQGLRSKSRLQVEANEVGRHLAQIAGTGLLPCLTTWYQRAALTDATESIRITLDSEIRYCPPQQIGEACRKAPTAYARASSVVFEIKAWGPLPGWLRALVRSIDEASDFSKFRAGMQAAGVSAP